MSVENNWSCCAVAQLVHRWPTLVHTFKILASNLSPGILARQETWTSLLWQPMAAPELRSKNPFARHLVCLCLSLCVCVHVNSKMTKRETKKPLKGISPRACTRRVRILNCWTGSMAIQNPTLAFCRASHIQHSKKLCVCVCVCLSLCVCVCVSVWVGGPRR